MRKAHNFLFVLGSQFIVVIATLIGIRAYTELLSPAEFGFSMLIMGSIALLDGVTSAALNQTLISFCPRYQGSERRHVAVGLTVDFLKLVAWGACAISGCLVIAAFPYPDLRVYILLPLPIFVYLCEECIKISLQSLLFVSGDYSKSAIWSACETVLGVILTIAFIVLFSPHAISFVAGMVCSRIACTVIGILTIGGSGYLRGIDHSSARKIRRDAIRFGLPVLLMAPLGWIASFLDRFIIGTFLGVSASGGYVAATSLVSRPYAITTTILTRFFRPQLVIASHSRKNNLTRPVLYWMLVAAAIGIFGAIMLRVLGNSIVGIMLAPQYQSGAVSVMSAYGIAMTLSIMTHAPDNALLTAGRSGVLLRLQVYLSGLTLLAITGGAYFGGPIGCVVGRIAAEIIKTGATTLLCRTELFQEGRSSIGSLGNMPTKS